MISRRRLCLFLIIGFTYVFSYLVLSRGGFVLSDRLGVGGFYFFEPRDSNVWRITNYSCVVFYYPLIALDNLIGTGRRPASEPMWGLTR